VEATAASAPAVLGRVSVPRPLLRLRSDEHLVAQFRAGDEEAFRVIHDRYRARLTTYARRMLSGSETDAEDVLQDVFLRAYRALRADERPLSLRAWLYRVAHNRCIDTIRRPTPDAADVFDASRTATHDPCTEMEQREDLRQLVTDLHHLPDQQRSALLMRELDGMSYHELADALGTTVSAVKSLLVRARVGLVEAAVARDADCEAIRHDLADAHERGVRASGRACRHTRECSACSEYRVKLVGSCRGTAALVPVDGSPSA
jgi:RNA polymerase sigma factor (sigma-70 family)